MKHITLIFFFSMLFNHLVWGQEVETSDTWEVFEDQEYSIRYPSHWDLDTSGLMGTRVIFFSKPTSDEDHFRENFNLMIQDLGSSAIDLDRYAKISEGQITTLITNGELLQSKRLRKDKVSFHKMIYTGDQGIYHIKFEQYYFIQHEKAYVLTLTCEASQYDAYQKVGEKILDSFKLYP